MQSPQSRSVSIALGRLRLAVIVCCWMVGLALFAQLIVWSLATFTDARFETVEEPAAVEPAPLIVQADPQRSHRPPRSVRGVNGEAEAPPPQESERENGASAAVDVMESAATVPAPAPPASPEIAYSAHDGSMRGIIMFTGAAGRAAMLALLALLPLAVALAISSATRGVEGAMSAFVWAILVGLLVLPLGYALDLPWKHGALTTYDHLVQWVDHVRTPALDERSAATAQVPGIPTGMPGGSLVFYARFCLAPIACIVGIALVGLRFSAGVEAGLVRKESIRLDPALEREASNMKVTSLHGGRAAGVLSSTMESDAMPSATQVSPGDRPRRLI